MKEADDMIDLKGKSMKKIRKVLTDMNLTTTSTPVRSGRNPAYYPILVLLVDGCQIDDINQVLKLYPAGAYLKEVGDRHRVLDDIYDIEKPVIWHGQRIRRKLARYRYHPDHGWLEEITQTWTVNADYPTALASGMITDFEDQGAINMTAAMRFGIQIVSLLLGNNDSAVRGEILDLLAKIMVRTGDDFPPRVEVDGDGEEIKLSL